MPATKRKSTHQVRREELEDLKKQIKVLQLQIDAMQTRVEEGAMSTSDHLQQLRRSQRIKTFLLEYIQDQHLVVAGTQSELANLQDKRPMNMLHSYIHLPKDWDKRRQLLMSLKDDKLNRAYQYVVARSQYLDLQTKHSSEQRFHDDNGALCCERFEVTQLVGVRSLKDVYHAAKFFLSNVEVNAAEALGCISERQEYDLIGQDDSIRNFRLVSTSPSDIVTESNKVMYTNYYEQLDLIGGPCAVVVTDSVDHDELNPYDSETRVRLDVNSALVMNELPYDKTMLDCGLRVVIIQCAVFVKIHEPKANMGAHKLYAIAEGVASWITMMTQTIGAFCDTSLDFE